MSFDIKNKIALVTGANRGIGKAIVDSLFAHGAGKVYVAVRSIESAQPLVETYGGRAVPIHIDLSDAASINTAALRASDVELVINNAGILQTASPLSMNAVEALKNEMDVNVIGLIHMAQSFAPILKNNGGGAFVQLNSVASMKNFADFATYSASKAAAYSITQALRERLGEQATLVLSVHPGPIATDMAADAGLGDIAESPSLVGEAIIEALEKEEFHVFPDSMAKMIGSEYKNFAANIVEANLMEG